MTQAISHILEEVELLSENERMELRSVILERVQPSPAQGARDVLEMAARVYGGLSGAQISEVEKIALNRRDFFNRDAV